MPVRGVTPRTGWRSAAITHLRKSLLVSTGISQSSPVQAAETRFVNAVETDERRCVSLGSKALGARRGNAMTTQRALEAMVAGRICAICGEEPRVAWVPTGETSNQGSGFQNPHEFRLRCNCWPKPPILEKPPKGAVARYLAGEEPENAIVKMIGERILAKRNSRAL